MIRAYDEYGNIIDLVEWEKQIRSNAIDDAKSVILQTLDNEVLIDTLHLRLEQLKAVDIKCVKTLKK